MSELLRTAILGTGQVGPGEDTTGTAADALVAKLPELERERAMLLRVGAAAILRRAGARALAVSKAIDSAPAETATRAPAGLASLLESVLSGAHEDLLQEATSGMVARSWRLPEELLPRALSERDPARRRQLTAVLGERGQWLAGRRKEWRWAEPEAAPRADALPEDADQRWNEGNNEERLQVLTWARQVAPERGRAWVESTFKSDKPEQRLRWLEALAVGFSEQDAPLLQQALTDRSQAVRTAAARLLWQLPSSAPAQALRVLVERAFPPAAAPSVEVQLPPEIFDKALEKLGIVEAPLRPNVGRRQWWLAQYVAATPPGWFCERLGASPSELLASTGKHDYREALLTGWTSATLRFGAADWAAPLWDAWFELVEHEPTWFLEQPLQGLTRLLSPRDLEPRLARCVERKLHLELLSDLPAPWPPAVASAVVANLYGDSPHLWHLLPLAASRLPLASLPNDALPSAGLAAGLESALEEFFGIVHFRRRLAEELSK